MAELHGVNAGLIASLPDTGPVVMVNLLRLRDREACKRYSELTMPLIKGRCLAPALRQPVRSPESVFRHDIMFLDVDELQPGRARTVRICAPE